MLKNDLLTHLHTSLVASEGCLHFDSCTPLFLSQVCLTAPPQRLQYNNKSLVLAMHST